MSAMFEDYEELMRVLRKAPPLTEERARVLAQELVTGLRGEEREVLLGVAVELVYKAVPEPSEGASQPERDRWEQHLRVVVAIAGLADLGEEFEPQAKQDLQRRRRERAACPAKSCDPLPSPAPEEEDDEPTIAEMRRERYSQADYERWLAPIIYDLAHPEVPVGVDRADQLMRLLWVLEGAGKAERDTAFEVAMSHAYNFTTHGRQQQVSYLAKIVSRGRAEKEQQVVEPGGQSRESQDQEYDRLRSQEQIMAKLLMDSTPDAVIQATHRVLEAQLQLCR
ncbi:MAG TPA: hypothetical protein VFG99_03470 [Chloroflexia bacterium]|nr:hypothetical protein [Chloroflexia bacterium]